MPSAAIPEAHHALPDTSVAELDAIVDGLHQRAEDWTRTSLAERITLLKRCLRSTAEAAEGWVEASCGAKQVPADGAAAGEEWMAGPTPTLRNLRLLVQALSQEARPRLGRSRQRPDGQHVVQVFPGDLADRVELTGVTGEVWIQPGKDPTQGAVYARKARGEPTEGGVALVLGGGNVASIGPMDALYKLFVDDEVVVVKSNPVNAVLGPHWERAFRPLVERGVFRVVQGGADVGEHLVHHPKVGSVHITGSDRTHDAIVWGGTPAERERRKAAGDPRLRKPITSELGCVTPVLVVPGEWTGAELRAQARSVAGMVTQNASYNCTAAKVLVLARDWPQREAFLDAIRQVLSRVSPRPAYYPGSQQRYEAFLSAYPNHEVLQPRGLAGHVPYTLFPDVPARSGEYAFVNEAFCGVLAEVRLDGADAASFLTRAVDFCNDELWGTLSANVVCDLRTQRAIPEAFDAAIAALRYGGICVNGWTGLNYGLVWTPWGAFPGHTLDDVGSGLGVVHNTSFLDHPQKSVVRLPMSTFPAPFWVPDRVHTFDMGRNLSKFEANPGILTAIPLAVSASRG